MVKEGPCTLLKVMWSRRLDLVRRRGINTVVEQWYIGLKVLGSQPGFPACFKKMACNHVPSPKLTSDYLWVCAFGDVNISI